MHRVVETVNETQSLNHPDKVILTPYDDAITNHDESLTQNVAKIRFDGGQSVFIKKEWYDLSDVFKQPVIFQSYERYMKWIYPLLNNGGRDLQFDDDVDTISELGGFIEEVYKYKLDKLLTEPVILDVSQNSGLVDEIQKMKRYINRYEGKANACWGMLKKRVTERMQMFENEWLGFIKMWSVVYQNEKYNSITYDLILQTIKANNIIDICVMNVKYNNIIFKFIRYFGQYVVKNDKSVVATNKYELSLMLPDASQTVSNIATSISGIITNTKVLDKSTLLRQVSNLVSMKSLIG